MKIMSLLRPSHPFTFRKMIPWGLVTGILIALGLSAILIFTGWLSVSDYIVGRWTGVPLTVAGFVMLASFLLGISGLFSVPMKVARPIGIALVIQSIIILSTFYYSGQLRSQIRRDGYERLAERSIPLIAAINRFYVERSRAPESLDELVPDFLSKVPRTHISTDPEYRYQKRGQKGPAEPEFADEPWKIYVFAGEISFDRFVYVPSHDYPQRGESGWYERIGKWAYYHE